MQHMYPKWLEAIMYTWTILSGFGIGPAAALLAISADIPRRQQWIVAGVSFVVTFPVLYCFGDLVIPHAGLLLTAAMSAIGMWPFVAVFSGIAYLTPSARACRRGWDAELCKIPSEAGVTGTFLDPYAPSNS